MQREVQQRIQEKQKKLQELEQAVNTLKVRTEQRFDISELSQVLLQSDSEELSVGHSGIKFTHFLLPLHQMESSTQDMFGF